VNLSPAERRLFGFPAGWGEGSMTVRARTVKGEQGLAACNTYINWALRRADYHVEISASGAELHVRCIERWSELKF
jgi:hypothetical protein